MGVESLKIRNYCFGLLRSYCKGFVQCRCADDSYLRIYATWFSNAAMAQTSGYLCLSYFNKQIKLQLMKLLLAFLILLTVCNYASAQDTKEKIVGHYKNEYVVLK